MAKYYIAYGSNLNTEQMMWRCPTARIVGTGFIHGYELLFKGSKSGSYLTIEKNDDSEVPVAVWKIDVDCEKSLDRYEGFPSFYYKKEFTIDVTGIKSKKQYHLDAFAYIMHEERKIGIPSREYVITCIQGYEIFGFDIKYLEKAYRRSQEEENAKRKQ